MRNYMNLMDNRHVVTQLTALFSTRRYSGNLERRRRVLLGRLHRANALISLREGDHEQSRWYILKALRENPLAPKAWLFAPLILLAPKLLARILPELPESAHAPAYPGNEEMTREAPG